MQGGGMGGGGGGYGGGPPSDGGGGFGPPSGGGGFPPPGTGGPPGGPSGYGPPSQGGAPPNQYGAAPNQYGAAPTQIAGPGGPGGPGANPYASPQQGFGPPMGQAPNPYGGQGRPGGEYEFSPEEDFAVVDLAKKMSFVGLMGVIFGVVLIFAGFGSCAVGKAGGAGTGFGYLIQGVFAIIVGIWTRGAAASFQRIADTQGNDIFNLMGALGHLRKIYGLQKVLIIICIVIFALAFVLGILGAILLAGRSAGMH